MTTKEWVVRDFIEWYNKRQKNILNINGVLGGHLVAEYIDEKGDAIPAWPKAKVENSRQGLGWLRHE